MIQKKNEFILITCSNFPEGGATANYLNLFCKGLLLNNQSISVWLLKGFGFGNQTNQDKKKNFTKEGILFTYLSSPHRPKSKLKKIYNDCISIIVLSIYLSKLVLRKETITLLVYNNELQFNIPIFFFSKLGKFKVISFVSEFYDKSVFKGSFFKQLKWYGFLFNFKFINRLSFRLIVFSSFLKNLYIKQGVDEKKIIIQPNLTDFDFWHSDNKTIKYTLGYSGTPSVKDGLIDLFRAISLLKKSNINVTLLVVGDSVFGNSLLPNLRKTCNELNISELVTFTGLVEFNKVKQYLSECEILTLTRPNIIQTQAGFPTKLGEYIAMEKKVLITNFGDTNLFFKNDELIFAECDNINSIAQKIQWILMNKDEASIIAQKGYLKAMKLLSYNEIISKIIPLIIR